MKRSPFTQLISVVLLLVMGVVGMVFVIPTREKVATLRLERDGVAADLQQLQADVEHLETLSTKLSESESLRKELAEAVPVGYDQDQLILDLQEIAKSTGFLLSGMSFSPSVDKDFGTVIRVSANLTGNYDKLTSFLQAVENADRLMQVTSLNVQLTNATELVFNLTLEAYYQ